MLQFTYWAMLAWIALPYVLIVLAASFAWAALWAPAAIAASTAILLLYRRYRDRRAAWRRPGVCRACKGTGRFQMNVPAFVHALKTGEGFGRNCAVCGGSGCTDDPAGIREIRWNGAPIEMRDLERSQ